MKFKTTGQVVISLLPSILSKQPARKDRRCAVFLLNLIQGPVDFLAFPLRLHPIKKKLLPGAACKF